MPKGNGKADAKDAAERAEAETHNAWPSRTNGEAHSSQSPTPPPPSTLIEDAVRETLSRPPTEEMGPAVLPNYRISARDREGNSAHFNFFAPPAFARMISELIWSRKVEDFKDASDFLRWCVYFGLQYLRKYERFESAFWGQYEATLVVMEDLDREASLDHVIEKMKEGVERRIAAGDRKEARRYVVEVRGKIGEMPDGYYKRKALKEIQGRFGELAGAGKGAKQ